MSTADLRGQLDFFTDVLGAELKALYWMHGAEGTVHAFLRLHDHSYLAFVHELGSEPSAPRYGATHAPTYTAVSAPGTLQHLAFSVGTLADLLSLRDRIRDRGHNVFGPVDHGLCRSIYFAGPEGLLLEAATSDEPIDERRWVDPEVAAALGIDREQVASYLRPEPFEAAGARVPQPPIDPDKPRFPSARYEWLMTASDDEILAALSAPEPPVARADESR